MSVLVQKFGGTSVASPEVILSTARHIAMARQEGYGVVVVVSAMAGVTDQLIGYVRTVAVAPQPREYDVVVSAGEQVTCGLMALVLNSMGIPAESWLGWQIPIQTSSEHSRGRIQEVDCRKIRERLEQGVVPVIAGFQGMTETGSITTLGRGGSDLTAVAVASSLDAVRCDLYKDVDGIYTADPKVIARARKLDQISYQEMLELSSLGSRVLQARSVEMALSRKVRLRVAPTFGTSAGTLIVDEDEVMEKGLIRGVVCNRGEALIKLEGIRNLSAAPAALFDCFAAAQIHVDMITQGGGDANAMTFTVPRTEMDQAVAIAWNNRDIIGFGGISKNDQIAKVSVVGIGLRNHADFARILFRTLAGRNIPFHGISTSEIKISILVDDAYAELACRSLHTAYGLDGDMES